MACLEEIPKIKDPLPSTDPSSKLTTIKESKLESTSLKNSKTNNNNTKISLSSKKINLAPKPVAQTMSASTSKQKIPLKPNNLKPDPIKLESSRLVSLEKNKKTITDQKLDIVGINDVFKTSMIIPKSMSATEQPTSQPFISTMFEGYPQPFASKSLVESSKSSFASKSATSSRKMQFYGLKKPKKSAEKCKSNGTNKNKSSSASFFFLN